MLLAPNSITHTLDAIEHASIAFNSCGVNPLFDLLSLHVTEERLSHIVIPAVASTAHARTKSVEFALTIEIIVAKLANLIRMDDDGDYGSSTAHRHR